MDQHAPSVVDRALDAFQKEGVRGVTRRVLPFVARGFGVARARIWRRHRAPLSVILLVPATADAGSVASALFVRRTRTWSRWLHELIVVTWGPESPREPLRLPNAPPTRHFHVPEKDLAIVANTGVALATSDAVIFADEHTAPLTAALLSTAAAALRGRVDALYMTEHEHQPAVSRRSGSATTVMSDDAVASVIGSASTPKALSMTAFRKRSLIQGGLFQSERGESFVSDALMRQWRLGHVVGLLPPSDPNRVFLVPRRVRDEEAGASDDFPPRVIYVVNGTDVRGGIRIVFEHCNRLRDRDIEAMIITFDEPLQTWFPELRAPLLHVRDFPATDVAVATFWTTANFVAELNCARYYFIQHDEALFEEDPEWKKDVRKTYRLPLEFVTISSWLVDLIKQEADKDAVLIPNGINREMFFPDPVYERGDKVRILVEGNRDIFWKGMDEAAEVLEGLDVEVWTLGKAGIRADRNFAYPPQEQLRGIYSSCDILLKTSWYEGMPLPHMEAMACGCMLVTTDVPGVRDYCVDGVNCLMAPPRDVAAIRRTLERALADEGLRATLIANGLATAEERFGWDDQMDRLADTYRRATAQARAGFARSEQGKVALRTTTGEPLQ